MTAAPERSVREEILAAAARAFAERGYHGMSMRALAKATGRSPAAFYNYFESKEDLLFFLQRDAFEMLTKDATEAVEGIEDPWSRLDAFVTGHVRYFCDHPDVMRVLVHEASALPPQRRDEVRKLKEGYFQIGLDIVSKLTARSATDPEVERATYCLFGMLNWIWGWYEPERHGSWEDVARTIQRMLVAGVAPDWDADPGSHPEARDAQKPPLVVHRGGRR